jgi:hypothetical protein
MSIAVFDNSAFCKVEIFTLNFNSNKVSANSEFGSKFSGDFTGILSGRALDLSPVSVVWVAGIEEFVDLHLPVVGTAKSSLD